MATYVAAPVSAGSRSAATWQLLGLDRGVLVPAEQVLQSLHPLDERLALVGGEEVGEALQQVAQLLGVLAHLVHRIGRRGRLDRPPVVEQPPLRLLHAGHDDVDQRVAGLRSTTRRVHRCGEDVTPAVQPRREVARLQALG